MSWLLCEEDALELDDEKVDELFDVLQRRFKGLTWDGVVFLGSEGGS